MSAHYELRVDGHLDDHWARWFDDLTLVREDDGTTALRGQMTDQAELHGLLAKVRDLGLTLISVNHTEAPHDGNPARRRVSTAPAGWRSDRSGSGGPR